MECTATWTKRRRQSSSGMTLVELMISAGIGGIVVSAVASLMFFSARSFAAMGNYVDLDQKSRNALDRMEREVRQANSVNALVTNSSGYATTFALNYGTGTSNLVFTYNTTLRTVTRTLDTETYTLLTECDLFVVGLFGRNTVSNSFDQFPTTNAASAKLIRFNWTCSRTIYGNPVNTESVQSAKIVIRKQG
jgi:type II secretory pathway pseudopilin PulG